MRPFNDNIKVRVNNADEFGFGADAKGVEIGIVEEVPSKDGIIAYGMHNFAFEHSWMNTEKLAELITIFENLIGKRIIWESYQDRGRRFRIIENDQSVDYVVLKMSDVLCTVKEGIEIRTVEDERGGSFKI